MTETVSKPALQGIPADVRSYIFALEGQVEASWAGKHVLIAIVAAFVAGVAVVTLF